MTLLASAPEATCAARAASGAAVVLELSTGEWGEACGPLVELLALPTATTATVARQAERALLETTLFRDSSCRFEGPGLVCRLSPATLVASGEVAGALPFALMRRDVDGRLSLRSGVRAEDDLDTEGRRQSERLAAYLVREGYFGSTATASWSPAEGAEPMATADLTVTVDVGESTTIRSVSVRNTDVLTTDDARDALQRYWFLSFIPRRFRPAEFDDDLDGITEALRKAGYPEAIVRGQYKVDVAADAVDVVLEVDTGARLELSFAGNVALDDAALGELSTFAEARSLDTEEIANTASAIREAYQRAGYFEAAVEGRTLDRPRPTLAVHYDVVEGRRAWLSEVVVTGTTALPPEALREQADLYTRTRAWPLRSGAWVDGWVERDQQAIAEVLKLEGFAAAAVGAETAVLPGGALSATFLVDAGPRRTVTAVSFPGLPAEVDADALLASLALRPERPYVQASLTPDRRRILDALAAAGYPRAEVSRKMKLPLPDQEGGVTITYRVEPSRRATYGGFLVRGNFETATSVVEHTLGLELGQPLSAKAVSDARRRLSATGIFGAVEITPMGLWREDTPTWLLVTVEERSRRALYAVLSFSTDDFFAVGADFTDRNLFGRALALDLELRFSNASQLGTDLGIGLRDRALLRITAPRPFGAPFDVEARAYYDFVTRPDTYDQRLVGGTVAVSRALLDRSDCAHCPSLVASVGYSLVATEVVVRTSSVVLEEPPATIGLVFARLSADHRDSPIDPRSGYQAEVRVELANRALAGPFADDAHDFWRLVPSARGYLTLGSPLEARLDGGEIIGGPFVLAGALSYGVAHPYGDRDTGADAIPRSETFAYGGDQSVRGLEDGASRSGTPSPPYLLFASLELRYYPLQNFGFGTLQVAGFGDLGTVAGHLGDLLDAPTLSAGAALRYVTPVGPLSIAYGWPLVRAPAIVAANPDAISATGRLHVSFGTSF